MNGASYSSPKKASLNFVIHEDEPSPTQNQRSSMLKRSSSAMPLPLMPLTESAQMSRINRARKGSEKENMEPMEELMAKLERQQKQLSRAQQTSATCDDDKSSTVTDPFAGTPPTESHTSDGRPDAAEVFKLKNELEAATSRMAQMNFELEQSRIAKHTVEQAIGSPFPSAQHLAFNFSNLQPTRGNTPFDLHHLGSVPANGLVNRMNPFDVARSLPPTRLATPVNDFPTPQYFAARPPTAYGQRPATLASASMPQMTPFGTAAPFQYPHNSFAQHVPIGTRPSPTATEFNAIHHGMNGMAPNTKNFMQAVHPDQPMNYRRLLDRNMSCDWKFIVDKIVCNNDQQASIFLQQKLKVGTVEQKFEIVQSIIEQAYALCVNRFGNFLVQRCFEHGTPQQIVSIARAIRGNTLNLSMDAFGCHVVQKAFDYVPEEYKAIMVHELLRRIPETVIHRYACHVWQKLFELRWRDEPPQIMRYVNDALRGMWHEVALGETGSLVVQNIFENCLEEDKRPCINEVLGSIDVVAHGQFGNWCIQHICEHGSNADRTRALEHILRFPTEYSMDQFASKVVEKCLKTAGTDFLDRYLNAICQSRPDRPRMPLIDIASDQYGNYLVQYVLTNGDTERRELISAHIRKHMVSLRGSKYGQRVAMLCSNQGIGPGQGPSAGYPMMRNGGAYAGPPGGYNERFAPAPDMMARSFPPSNRRGAAMGGGMCMPMGFPAGFSGPYRG